jgi:hypothetical protein
MDTIPAEFQYDPYAIRYGQAYIGKMRYLEEVIAFHEETGRDTFNVFNFEGGLGKSLQLLKILDRKLLDSSFRGNFLIVKKFNSEIDKAVQFLVDRGHFDVLGITAENWTSEWSKHPRDLQNMRVIFISHERYVRMCLSQDRDHFTKNRDVLIIDEKVIFPIYTFNKKLYDSVRTLFARTIQKELDLVCEPLHDWIEKFLDSKNTCNRVRAKIDPSVIQKFKAIVQSNRLVLSQTQRDSLEYFLQGLDIWYQTTCVHNAGNISGVNPKHRHWGLKNNLILDASASIDGVYKMNPAKFNLINQGLVIDHGKCKFNIYNFNTSKSSIRKHELELFPEIVAKIKETLQKEDRILIICHKENAKKLCNHLQSEGIQDVLVHEKEKQYDGQQVVINWHGNIVGKNEYSQFNKCWLIATPNLPFEQYLIHYVQYSNQGLGHKGMELHNGRFANETFKKVQVGYIAAEMYQALKRIQRVVVPEGEFNIVSNDPETVEQVLKRFKNACQRETYSFTFKEKQEAEREEKRSQKVAKLEKYLSELPIGRYKKMVVRDAVKINQAHFAEYLKHERVLRMIQNKKLLIHYREIEILE